MNWKLGLILLLAAGQSAGTTIWDATSRVSSISGVERFPVMAASNSGAMYLTVDSVVSFTVLETAGVTLQAYDAQLDTWATIAPGTGVGTFLATPSSANLRGTLTDETGGGSAVFADSPTLVTPALGTPSAVVLTNGTGLPVSTGISGLGTGVATALAVNVGSAGAPVVNGGALGTPSSGTATNLTGLPISTGVSGLGSGVATFLATPSSANLASAVTDETGTGALVLASSPTLTTPALGTPSAVVLTNGTALPLTGIVAGSDDTTPVSSGAAWVATAVPDCDDSGGNHLNYDTGTNAYSCGTSSSAGGITGFTAAEATSSPNNTVYADSLTASGSTTNADAVIAPKAAGAFMIDIPDGTSAGGNKRGLGAADLQNTRNAATQVASGAASFVAGERNTASATGSFAIGYGNTVSATNSGAFGQNNLVSGGGTGQLGIGTYIAASGDNAIGIGYDSTASGNYSLAFGYNADTRSIVGARAFGGPKRSANGDAQVIDQIQRITTTDATETTITNGGGAASTSNILVMPNNSSTTCTARAVAMTANAAVVASWEVKATGKRVTNAAGTALVGSTTITTLGQDAGASSWVFDIKADTTNGGLVGRFTGQSSTTIHVVNHMTCVQNG